MNKVSIALIDIARSTVKASGYPYHQGDDPNVALAYGLVIGSCFALSRWWEDEVGDLHGAQDGRASNASGSGGLAGGPSTDKPSEEDGA